MWVYKYIDKQTRTQVPSYWTFMRSNQDLIKMWLENTTIPVADRIGFSLRLIRWIVSICILFLFVDALIAPEGSYFESECNKR